MSLPGILNSEFGRVEYESTAVSLRVIEAHTSSTVRTVRTPDPG
jgi:hypothetical protein